MVHISLNFVSYQRRVCFMVTLTDTQNILTLYIAVPLLQRINLFIY